MVNFISVTPATCKLWLIHVRACSFETIGKRTFGGSFFYLRGVPRGNHGSKANHEKNDIFLSKTSQMPTERNMFNQVCMLGELLSS